MQQSNRRNHFFSQSNSLKIAASLAVIAVLTGCNSKTVKPAQLSCSAPSTINVEQAFSQSQETLANQACHYYFEQHESALMQIAKGDPSTKNQEHFYHFYTHAAKEGIISKQQAKEQYSRYFTSDYKASLPDNYSNCALGKRLDSVLKDLKAEAQQKKLGLMEVLGERDSWFKAKRNHDDLVYLLQTTDLACK